ncbi:MAG: nucleotidyl transferase AbiEii/AbiGii toxin family protein [Candidatus Magasanikbacteria bacterium]
MLTFEQIQSYYESGELQGEFQLVEYIQHEILDSFYKQKGSENFSFMGGTAIRIGYGGNRFSEDLDFDNFGSSFDEFKDIVKQTLKDLESKGFKTEYKFVKKGAFHCYIKFPNILYENDLSPHKQEKILVRIDTVEKDQLFQTNSFTVDKFDIFREIIINPKDIILSQKLITILDRNRTLGRDFYDVMFLQGKSDPNFKYIEQKLNISKDEFIDNFIEQCGEFDYKKLADDVKPLLLNPEQSERILKFQDYMTQKLESYL